MAGCKSKSCASNMYIVSIAGMVILLIGSDYMYMSAIGGVKPIVLNSSIHFQILGNSVLPLTEMPNVSSSTEKSKEH